MLYLTITDATGDAIVPARVEIEDANGVYHVAKDALLFGGDCDDSNQGAGFIDLPSTLAGFSDRLNNPYTKSQQFYSDGESAIELPAGTASIRIFKGPEYNLSITEVEISAAESTRRQVQLTRWVNMPEKGWYSSDDHLHIPRPVIELNPLISKMMQAEDIHVANLLQMGKIRNFKIASQYAHGEESHYQEGNYILAAGQENPRTHFLGHTITLGADSALHKPDKYLIYRLLWEEAVKRGGLNGFAHGVDPNGSLLAAHDGMAVILPHALLHFIEVLQFNRSNYESWYDILALGFRVAPAAGSDFPCGGQTIPGHERFYTKVDGPFTYKNWLEALRKGRTFVTTGPIVELRVNDEDIGGEIVLEKAASVQVTGSVYFDPQQDDLFFAELIRNGNVIKRFSRVKGEAKIDIKVRQQVDESSWFALRAYGARFRENTIPDTFQFRSFKPTSNVHSAPIYVTLKNQPGIEKSVQSKTVARSWLARLEDLESVLAKENMEYLAGKLALPDFDAVPADILMNNREELLNEIEVAKEYFKGLMR